MVINENNIRTQKKNKKVGTFLLQSSCFIKRGVWVKSYSLRHIKKLLLLIEQKKMSVPAGFSEKTPQWIRRHYNGIGAEWMPRRVRNFITKALTAIEPGALIHDVEYADPRKSYWKFTVANMRFWLNAIKIRRFFIGGACALLCQLCGWGAYRDGKESMAYCNFYLESKNGTP